MVGIFNISPTLLYNVHFVYNFVTFHESLFFQSQFVISLPYHLMSYSTCMFQSITNGIIFKNNNQQYLHLYM